MSPWSRAGGVMKNVELTLAELLQLITTQGLLACATVTLILKIIEYHNNGKKK